MRIPADGHHVSRGHPSAVRGHQVDAPLRVLHHVLGAVDEDVEGIADVQGEIGAQAQAHRQTTAAVDDANPGDRDGVRGRLDAQRPAPGRAGQRNGNRTEVLAVLERLVGLLSCGRYVINTRSDRGSVSSRMGHTGVFGTGDDQSKDKAKTICKSCHWFWSCPSQSWYQWRI